MKIKENAFSLVEIIIATSIIVISVFWVYKLIWENTKIINNSGNIIQIDLLFPTIEECVDNIWINSFLASYTWTYNFNFWHTWSLNECNTWAAYDIELDDIRYEIIWNITDSWSNFINWQFLISSDEIKTLTWYYLQK